MGAVQYLMMALFMLLNGPAECDCSMPESKQSYLTSLLSTPLQIGRPAMNSMWHVIFSHVRYVYDVCGERESTVIDSADFTPCGRIKVICLTPHFGQCRNNQLITVNVQFHVNVTFLSFNVSNSFSHCQLQFVQVSFLQDNKSISYTFCGMKLPWSECAHSNNVTLFYESSVDFHAYVSGVYEVLQQGEIYERPKSRNLFSIFSE